MIGEIIGGIASAIGNIYGANASAKAAEQNTEKQIAWERERATNAHQWEVQDLEKAGLNPILSAGGSGAQTGSISPSMPDTSGYGNAGLAIQQAVNAMFENKLKNAQTAQAAQQTQAIGQQISESKTKQTLMAYQMGLISKEQALKEIEKQQAKLNLAWSPYEKGAKIAGDVIGSVTPFMFLKGLTKSTATAAAKTAGKISKKAKDIGKWTKLNDKEIVNLKTGEIRPTKLKDFKLIIKKKKG